MSPNEGEKKFPGYHAAPSTSQRPLTTAPGTPTSRLLQDMSTPARNPQYQTATTVYPRFVYLGHTKKKCCVTANIVKKIKNRLGRSEIIFMPPP
jgi:hypothetical protein